MASSDSTQTLADMVQSQANSALNSSEAGQALAQFWPKSLEEIQQLTNNDLKQQELPLARIKKIMKLDDDVKMISAEAPVLFSKAAEIFIGELTLRAWVHTEDNKRRTLQRNDIAMAISKYDQFDFLIDIVPREEVGKPAKIKDEKAPNSAITDQVQYYLNLAQQSHQALQQLPNQPSTAGIQSTSTTPQTIQIMQPGGQIQTINVMQAPQVLQQSPAVQAAPSLTVASPTPTNASPAAQVQQAQQIILQNAAHQAQQSGSIQIVQQIVGPNGEIQQIPIQLTPQQLQMLRMQLGQLGAGNVNQTVVLQAQQPAQQTQVIELQTTE